MFNTQNHVNAIWWDQMNVAIKKTQKKTARERKIIPFCRKKGLNISKCSQKTYIKKWQTIQRQNDKQRSTKHYRDRKLKTEQHEPHLKRGWTQVHRKSRQYVLNIWHPSCYTCYKPSDTFVCQEWGKDRIEITIILEINLKKMFLSVSIHYIDLNVFWCKRKSLDAYV